MQFPWTPQRQNVFLDRYALRHNGEVLEKDVRQMIYRVAGSVAHNVAERMEFTELLSDFKFLPAGRILSAAGSDQHSATWYNCFVLGVNPSDHSHGKDSRDAILNTISRMVELNCRGGGVGINWSALRPDGSYVRGVHGISTGSIGWMRGADAMADQVRQGGSRTAALMFLLNDWHPDITYFIHSNRFRRANFSVAISDQFMEDLDEGKKKWTLRFPDTTDPAYDLLWDGDINKWEYEEGREVIYKEVDLLLLWNDICDSAWAGGNPGLVFIDRCNDLSLSGERLIGTNPCGEQPLPEYGSCNLGSINLVAMCNENGDINKNELAEVVRSAVKFLDNVIDKSPPTYSEIDGLQRLYRRIGLGTMGLADVLILNKLKYGSEESLAFIKGLYGAIQDMAFTASSLLAETRGVAPKFSKRIRSSPFIGRSSRVVQMCCEAGLRNTALLTQAPTGTISMLAGVSSGIEPVFASEYHRKDAIGEYDVVHPLFQGTKHPYHVTAYDISPEQHVAVQAILQKYVDSSISKTVNLPACSQVDTVNSIYRLAYACGCKGITVYRGDKDSVLSCKVCTT